MTLEERSGHTFFGRFGKLRCEFFILRKNFFMFFFGESAGSCRFSKDPP